MNVCPIVSIIGNSVASQCGVGQCSMGSMLKYLMDGNPIIRSDVASFDTILSTKIWRNFINLSGTGTATVIEMKP